MRTAPGSGFDLFVGRGASDSVPNSQATTYSDGVTTITASGGTNGAAGVGGSNTAFTGGSPSADAGGGGAGGGGNGTSGVGINGGDGGPPVSNDWWTGVLAEYAEGGAGCGRAGFGDPDIICGDGAVGSILNNTGNGGRGSSDIGGDGRGVGGVAIVRYLRQD